MNLTAAQSMRTRRMRMKKSDVTNVWSINERSWVDVVNSGFTEVFANPRLNDIEVWEIQDSSGGWHHPLHIHLFDVKILDRDRKAPFAYEGGTEGRRLRR